MKNLNKLVLYALAGLLSGLGVLPEAAAQQDVITTVVGNGPSGIPALSAAIVQPYQVATDAQGNRYFVTADGNQDYTGSNRVFKITSGGTITVVAGTGISGYSGDGGLAINAQLNVPQGVAVDSAGNIYISDTNNCLIRKVTASTGKISTIAGVLVTPTSGIPYGSCATTADGQPANQTALNHPFMLSINPTTSDLYFAETTSGVVRKIAGAKPTSDIKTVAGNGTNCGGSAPYGDGGPATSATLCYPQGVTVDASVTPANLFLTGYYDCSVREVVGSSGRIYTVAGTTRTSCGFVDGVTATSGKLTTNAWQTAVKVSGSTTTVDVADFGNRRVRQFTLKYSGGVPVPGTITTIAGNGSTSFCGDGQVATSACVAPVGLAFDASGNLIVTDYYSNRLREISKSTGVISSIEGWGTATSTNTLYSDPLGISGAPGTGVQLYQPIGVFADPSSTKVYVATYNTENVYAYDSATGKVNNFAGNGLAGFGGDGKAANGATVQLNDPQGAATDSAGNVYIADSANCVIRKVSKSTGEIRTIAGGSLATKNGCGDSGDDGPAVSARLDNPVGLAVDSDDNLYIADNGNGRVRKVDLSSGTITTVAGIGSYGYNGDGIPATVAQLYHPTAVALDELGNLYIADQYNHRIRQVDWLFGTISTVAGTGQNGYNGDGIATGALLSYPTGLAVDPSGNIFFTDNNNHLLRWIDPAGNLVTYAGTPRTNGYAGDGSVATTAQLSYPQLLSRDSKGNTFFADWGNGYAENGRVRKVTPFAGFGRSTGLVTFDKQRIGTTSDFQAITLSAVGPTTISSIKPPTGFTEIDNCTGATLAAGETCEIDVSFTPTKGGVIKGALSISSTVFFPGQAKTVELQGEGAGLSISGTLVFPTQLVGQASSKSVTLKNSGASVKISSIGISGTTSFKVTGGTCPAAGGTLAAGASCTITVTFNPTAAGVKKYALTVNSSDPGSPLLTAVSGTGTQLTTSPASLAFGTLSKGTTKTLNLTVKSSYGSFSLSPAITGSGFTILATGNTCTAAIAAGQSCTLPVKFAPTSAKAYSGKLELVSGSSASPVIALTGTGK